VVLSLDFLGEQTLNRIAEMALRSQLSGVDALNVQVKTDFDLLSQGKLASLAIDGQGVRLHDNLRIQQLTIHIGEVGVSPFKALRGNIVLSAPVEGKAAILLTMTDINQAFNAPLLLDAMQALPIQTADGQVCTLDVLHVECQSPQSHKLAINATIQIRETGEKQLVSFTTVPAIAPGGRNVQLTEVQYTNGQELSPALTQALMEQATHILDLENFEMDGIALQLQQLDVQDNQLAIAATAFVTHFPSA
jgi:hypothetical protein